MAKLGLVVEGGGMRGIYSCGALDFFLEENIQFDYCVAVSAGSANVATFLARQKKRTYRFYTVHTQDKRYMSFRNMLKTGSFFGLEFIYDTLTNEIDPIDYDVLLEAASQFHVVATEAESGQAHYFGNADFKRNDCRVLMASCAVPAMCKPVNVYGKVYYDGGIADPIPVKKALVDGCDRVVVVLSKPRGFVKQPERLRMAYSWMLRRYPNTVHALNNRHIIYNESLEFLKELEEEGRAVVIAPSAEVEVGMTSKDLNALDRLYALGLDDAAAVMGQKRSVFSV